MRFTAPLCAAGFLLAAWPGLVSAQTTGQDQELSETLRRLQERLDDLERRHQEDQQRIQQLEDRLAEIEQRGPAPRAPAPPGTQPGAPQEADQQKIIELENRLGQLEGTAAPFDRAKEIEEIKEAVKSELGQSPGAPGLFGLSSADLLGAQPITVARAGSAYLNISFDSLFDFGWSTERDVRKLQVGDHDPSDRGFTMPNTEFVFEGAVDPYFKGLGDVVVKIDEEGETTTELEEAYLQTTSLPWNLQVRGGLWFTEFGRHNPLHPHQWDFIDQPLVLGRMFGPEGFRNPGARLSWLAPTPFYTELFLTVMNGKGETAWSFRNPESEEFHGGETVDRGLRGAQDLTYVPRLVSSFELSDTQTLLLGASAAFGPNNTGRHANTQIYGVDAYWKWRPVNAQRGFPFVSWQTEAMYRRYEADKRPWVDVPEFFLPAENLGDWGLYSQLLWGFKPRWVVGLRGEFVGADDGAFSSDLRIDRTRIAPNLTWYATEFSKLRLQYNYDHRQSEGDDHSVWMQAEFLLGSHGAHKF